MRAPMSMVATIAAHALQAHAQVCRVRTSDAPTGIDRNTCASAIQGARLGWPYGERVPEHPIEEQDQKLVPPRCCQYRSPSP
jgi:hypothetical protein